jgi:hypothetical protein
VATVWLIEKALSLPYAIGYGRVDIGIRGALVGFAAVRTFWVDWLGDTRVFSDAMGRAGIEPATLGLKVPCSTN